MKAVLTLLALLRTPEVFGQQALDPNFAAQYHIQTDLGDGNGRFFRFQTHTGQYRKEVVLPDGSQEGTYGWVDPNGVLRLFEYIADDQGYRIVKESLFKVGNPNPDSTVSARGGDLNIGFDVYPLDGSVATTRLGAGAGLPATRLHLPEGALAATNGYTVSSLVSTNQELRPNPVSKQIGATFFSGAPAPPAPKRVVVGAEATAPQAAVERDNFVIGHSAAELSQAPAPSPPAPARRSGIVIGLSHNTPVVESRASAPRRSSRPSQGRPRPRGIVIGSTRRRRQLTL